MKHSIILTACLALLAGGCTEEGFDYALEYLTPDQIDQVVLYTGTDRMIADGQARLDFIVELYREGEVREDGNTIRKMMPVDLGRLPAGSVKIFDGQGREVGDMFSTTDASSGSVSFYAEIGGARSETKTVALRAKPALPSKLYVDIIFHVFERLPTDPWYDPLSYQELDYERLVTAVERLNAVFNAAGGTGPNTVSANIEFRLARFNPQGDELTRPGYKRIDYDNTVIPTSLGYYPDLFAGYMNAVDGRIWDPDRYLNVVVMPSGTIDGMMTVLPQYQIVPAGETPLQPIIDDAAASGYPRFVEINDISQAGADVYKYKNCCVGVPVTVFRPGDTRPVSIAFQVGQFYGLFTTRTAEGATDYCEDTQNYSFDNDLNPLTSPIKVGWNGEKFRASNAMDPVQPFNTSLRNNLTADQVVRVRYVIANCPGRQNGVTQ